MDKAKKNEGPADKGPTTPTPSVVSSPSDRRPSTGTMPTTKPPRSTSTNSPAADEVLQQDPSPMASPSSISISSKTTIRTGGGLHRLKPEQQPPPLPLDSNTSDGPSTFRLQPISRPSASPKLSSVTAASTASARKMANSTHSSSQPPIQNQPPQQQQQQQQQQIFSKLNHPPLPLPRKARRCPLFCCFYAEFDNVVGPKICYESPLGFMEQSTDVSLTKIHKLLASNFDRILSENGTESATDAKAPRNSEGKAKGRESSNNPTTPPSPSQTQPIKPSMSTDSVITNQVTNTANASSVHSTRKQALEAVGSNTQHSAVSSNTRDSQPATTSGGDSIFDSMSDFIITGPELTGNIVNLSAFNLLLLTRPTIIHNTRYERNSLLFCVGFILRRSEDPRPFRPILSKLALTLKRMEIESDFLSKHSSREQLQPLLDRILVSLNCTQWETNLVVNNNVLNFKLFHPPKFPASPVPDHAVPILMRRDWQVQMYDWDLAINWVVLHIDGVANARQISKKAEVDMEMVRNCLRVLKHHGVISVVDMFFYSNRYSPTKRATAMLAGHEPSLLQEAADYVSKRPQVSMQTTPTPYSNLIVPLSPTTASPTLQEKFVHPPLLPAEASPVAGSPILPVEIHDNVAAAVGSSLLGSSLKYATFASYQSHDPHLFSSQRREDQKELKIALAELYCAFNRNLNFGDLWLALAAGKPRSSSSADKFVERKPSHGTESRDQTRYHNHYQGTNSSTRGDSIEISGSEGTREQVEPTDTSSREHYFERLRSKTACADIDWADMFDSFDHRRFVSFGLVNGLLERVHNYPFVLNVAPGSGHKKEDTHRSPTMVEDALLANSASRMMDGMHCDDHIVSILERPIDELIDVVERVQGKKVLATYACAMDKR